MSRSRADLERAEAAHQRASAAAVRTLAARDRTALLRQRFDRLQESAQRREVYVDERDRLSAERERLADERERIAEEREAEADERERLADERQTQADHRERLADRREAEADDRDARSGMGRPGLGPSVPRPPERGPGPPPGSREKVSGATSTEYFLGLAGELRMRAAVLAEQIAEGAEALAAQLEASAPRGDRDRRIMIADTEREVARVARRNAALFRDRSNTVAVAEHLPRWPTG